MAPSGDRTLVRAAGGCRVRPRWIEPVLQDIPLELDTSPDRRQGEGAHRDDAPLRRPAFRPVPLRIILPNLVTLLALCLGLTAVRFAFESRFETAVIAV